MKSLKARIEALEAKHVSKGCDLYSSRTVDLDDSLFDGLFEQVDLDLDMTLFQEHREKHPKKGE